MGLFTSHKVTLWMDLGEDPVTYKRTWARRVIVCRAEEKSGSVASMNGSVSTDGLALFIPPQPGYVDPDSFTEEGWTLRDGDSAQVGVSEDTTPPAGSCRLTGVIKCCLHGDRVHHWEVSAE